MNETIAKIEFKDTYYGTAVTLLFVTTISMAVMFALFAIYCPVWLTVIIFLAVMYGLINISTAFHTVTISNVELNRTIIPTNSKMPFKPKSERHEWNQVKWYKEGKDKGRYSNEFEFLKIGFNNGIVWTITDSKGANKEDFSLFKKAFIQQINLINNQTTDKTILNPNTSINITNKTAIKRKASFYESIWAKIYVILLCLIIAAYVTFLIFNPKYIKDSIVFKLFVVIIPGFIYMFYRTFKEKHHEQTEENN